MEYTVILAVVNNRAKCEVFNFATSAIAMALQPYIYQQKCTCINS